MKAPIANASLKNGLSFIFKNCYNAPMDTHRQEKRRFFRHPITVPIQLRMERGAEQFVSESNNISLGGLNFYWPKKINRGSLLAIVIPVKEKLFNVTGKVVYSREDKKTDGDEYQT